jgi:hypothetical protein
LGIVIFTQREAMRCTVLKRLEVNLRHADHEGDAPRLLYAQFTHGFLLSRLIGSCGLPHCVDFRPTSTADRRLISLIEQRYGIWHLSMARDDPSCAGIVKVHARCGEGSYHLLILDVIQY